MIEIPCPKALWPVVALGAAVGFACNSTPPPASPVAGVQAAAPASSVSSAPRIVGTVLLSSTGKGPAGGGIVYLEDAPKLPGVATTATIDVDHKEFSPFIAVISTGGTVTFGNKDALSHHVFSPDVPNWDTGYLRKNDTARRTFDSPGPIALLCNIHPEMLGYLLVMPSTYFGRVAANGGYVIANVPPGTYRATAWAPRIAVATQSVTVGPAGTVTANFELRAATATTK
jgi:plastocyanin